MSVTDELIAYARNYAKQFHKGDLPLLPRRKLAIVACMDARLLPARLFGLEEGDAHVIRNAGGVVTDDVIRSVSVSQHHLGTTQVMVIHHTDCGMLTFTDEQFKDKLEEASGERPEWDSGAFPDLEGNVRDSIRKIVDNPFIPNTDSVRGFVYEVETGALREVS